MHQVNSPCVGDSNLKSDITRACALSTVRYSFNKVDCILLGLLSCQKGGGRFTTFLKKLNRLGCILFFLLLQTKCEKILPTRLIFSTFVFLMLIYDAFITLNTLSLKCFSTLLMGTAQNHWRILHETGVIV